jgi:hypothetical protein
MQEQLLIIEPDGPQGVKLGLGISSSEQMKKLDEAVGQLPDQQRKDLTKMREIARELNIPVVKP